MAVELIQRSSMDAKLHPQVDTKEIEVGYEDAATDEQLIKGGTRGDAADMSRLGKKQELRVRGAIRVCPRTTLITAIEKLHIPFNRRLCYDPTIILGKYASRRQLWSYQWRDRRDHLDDGLCHCRCHVYDLLHGRDGFDGPYGGWTIPLGIGIRTTFSAKATQLHRWYVKMVWRRDPV